MGSQKENEIFQAIKEYATDVCISGELVADQIFKTFPKVSLLLKSSIEENELVLSIAIHNIESYKIDLNAYKSISFIFANEKYMIKAEFKRVESDINPSIYKNQFLVIAKFSDSLYQQQRRNNFRVTIPSFIKAICNIQEHNKAKIAACSFAILDLSSSGCRILVSTNSIFKKNDLLLAQLNISDFDQLLVELVVKNCFPRSDGKATILGLQFKDINPSLDQKLFLIVRSLSIAKNKIA